MAALLHPEGGRAALLLGPRFRPQDLVCITRRGKGIDERTLTRLRAPALRGPHGWVR